MAAEFDASEFVDREFETAQRASFRGAGTTASATLSPPDGGRAPTREDVDNKVGDLQSKLAELKRAQTELKASGQTRKGGARERNAKAGRSSTSEATARCRSIRSVSPWM